MNKNNFALMAALYDMEGAGLYQDIYFPIVRYALTVMYSTQREHERYYDLDNLQLVIETKFGIKMPLLVLKQCVKAIGSQDNGGVKLTVYENGAHFLIKQVWDTSEKESIDFRLAEIERGFDRLEKEFQNYLKNSLIETDNTFLSFIKDNSVDIYQYFEDGGASLRVNEDYYHIIRFLNILKVVDADLFNIANNIFWGSIVAGFLQRERDINTKPTEKVHYFLDTSLVLAVLDLDSEENVAYANELIDMINASGGFACLHGFTLREIDSILYSVEKSQRPYPNSSIEKAYYRRGLTPSKVLKIRTTLHKSIEEKGIIVEPLVSERQASEIAEQYKNNAQVKELKVVRIEHEESYASTHDIFMTDFIKKKRGDIISAEKASNSFVTLNAELIGFIKMRSQNAKFPYLIHPSKITMDLWLHNSKCIDLKTMALPEAMSRCMALNNSDVRRKLRVVTKYSKDSDYTTEDYVALELALINRSRSVMAEFDAIQDANSNDATKAGEHLKEMIRLAVDEEMKRRNALEAIQLDLQKTKEQTYELSEEIAVVQKENEKKNEELAQKDIQIKRLERLSELNSIIPQKESELSTLRAKRDKSVNMVKYWVLISVEIIGVLIVLYGLINFIVSSCKTLSLSGFDITFGVAAGLGIIYGIAKCQNLYILSPRISKKKQRDEQLAHWISEYPCYIELEKELQSLVSERKSLKP